MYVVSVILTHFKCIGCCCCSSVYGYKLVLHLFLVSPLLKTLHLSVVYLRLLAIILLVWFEQLIHPFFCKLHAAAAQRIRLY